MRCGKPGSDSAITAPVAHEGSEQDYGCYRQDN